MKTNHLWLFLSFGLFVAACKKDPTPAPVCNPGLQTNTRFFEFTNERGQTFLAWTTDIMIINQVLVQLTRPQDQRNQHINGRILEIPEGCEFNQNWSWYFDPNDWALADASIELCDGDPQFVEENLEEYIRTGRYCPWSSIVLREIDNPF